MNFQRALSTLDRISLHFGDLLLRGFEMSKFRPPPTPVLLLNSDFVARSTPSGTSDPLREFLGLLWNTPKQRRSLEKRHFRRFAGKEWGSQKIMRPNRKIRIDPATGEPYVLGRLGQWTYNKVMEETRQVQKRMADVFGAKPKDKEVAILYSNESDNFEGKKNVLVVEMEKARPAFFSANLMQKVKQKQGDSDTTTVRPSGLG